MSDVNAIITRMHSSSAHCSGCLFRRGGWGVGSGGGGVHPNSLHPLSTHQIVYTLLLSTPPCPHIPCPDSLPSPQSTYTPYPHVPCLRPPVYSALSTYPHPRPHNPCSHPSDQVHAGMHAERHTPVKIVPSATRAVTMHMYLSVTIFRNYVPGAPQVLTPLVKVIHRVAEK